MAENFTEGCLLSDTDTTIFQLSKMEETFLWQTFSDYLFAADDVWANLAPFHKNLEFKKPLKNTQ